MHVDHMFNIQQPDGYIDSAFTVGRICVHICNLCGAFVQRESCQQHADWHNAIEESINSKQDEFGPAGEDE